MPHSLLLLLLGRGFATLSSHSQLVRNRKHLLPEETESRNRAERQSPVGDYLANTFGRKYSLRHRKASRFSTAAPSLGGSLAASGGWLGPKVPPAAGEEVCGDRPPLPGHSRRCSRSVRCKII